MAGHFLRRGEDLLPPAQVDGRDGQAEEVEDGDEAVGAGEEEGEELEGEEEEVGEFVLRDAALAEAFGEGDLGEAALACLELFFFGLGWRLQLWW